ncbi:exodeoxyribonuclease V subunit alpha [Colwelliaceae bacterium 6471]
MDSTLTIKTGVYASFREAQQQISGIEAIDYFLAKELVGALCHDDIAAQNIPVVFHLILALNESLRNGHTCLPINTIAMHRFGFLSDNEGIVSHNGFVFDDADKLCNLLSTLNIGANDSQPIVFAKECLYLRRYYQFEHELSEFIVAKLNHRSEYSLGDIEQCLATLFPDFTDTEIDWQLIGVANALNKNFSVIAGGPGTGKTYTVTKLLAAMIALHQLPANSSPLKISLVAPTGKAAQRLSESICNAVNQFRGEVDDTVLNAIPEQAQTIHRLLGVIHNSPNFRHHQDNLLDVDVLLIDEVSMVDLALMTRVFRALPDHTKVILLGDADQLPSVGVGSVLADIAPRPHQGFSADNIKYLTQVTNVRALPKAKNQAGDHVTFLLKSRRFDGEGGIGQIASAVINGQCSKSWQLLTSPANEPETTTKEQSGLHELQIHQTDANDWLPELVSQYYAPLYRFNNVAEAFIQLSRFRVLCATRQGEFGVEKMNDLIQTLLTNQGIIPFTQGPYHGQPIMISENDYRLGLYNGDVGIMWRNDDGHLMATFESQEKDKAVEFKRIIPSRLPKYETVYAMTIHKTQGSEFEHVAMVLPKQSDNRLLSRELLYTGITRAKKQLSIACSANVWRQGVETQVKRFSGLTLY